LKNPVARSTVG